MKDSTFNLLMFSLKDWELQENGDLVLYVCTQNRCEESVSGHSLLSQTSEACPQNDCTLMVQISGELHGSSTSVDTHSWIPA